MNTALQIRPILSTLGRHKTAAGLIALEIALTCAIISNAVFLISTRLDRMSYPSGVAVPELLRVLVVGISQDRNAEAQAREDLAALQALPGVKSVATSNQVPFTSSSWNSSINLEADQTHPTANASYYIGSEDLLETLGLRLVAGRDFTRDEYVEYSRLQSGEEVSVPALILSEALARRLFPDGSAIGRVLYLWGDEPTRVVGVVEHLIRPNDIGGPAEREFTFLGPVTAPTQYGTNYLLRVDRSRRAEVIEAAQAALRQVNPNRIILEEHTKSLEEIRADFYQRDRAMAWLLVSVCVALLVVTALGIVGLASFWVQQRTRQIGIRRALGATRQQIVRYFQVENLLIASAGIVLGMALAYAINGLLMERYELPRLPWHYLPVGALCLWLLGQVSVLGPALRAAAVPPAVATRSV